MEHRFESVVGRPVFERRGESLDFAAAEKTRTAEGRQRVSTRFDGDREAVGPSTPGVERFGERVELVGVDVSEQEVASEGEVSDRTLGALDLVVSC